MGLDARTLMNIFSTLPTLIVNAEEAFSGKPGSGALKKKFVLDSVNAAVTIYEATEKKGPVEQDQRDRIADASSGMIDSIVGGMNAVYPKGGT